MTTPAPDIAAAPRQPDWEAALAALALRWQHSAYEAHRTSCLHFARDAILAITGIEPLARLGLTIDDVTTPIGAARLLHRFGGDAAAIITAVCGAPVPPLLARRGDLAAVPVEADAAAHGGWSIGLVDGGRILLTAHDAGLTTRPVTEAHHAWRVGA